MRQILLVGCLCSLWASPVILTIDSTHLGDTLDRNALSGTCLPIWNAKSNYNKIRSALIQGGFHYFRFPNGSTSNNYHWNGQGTWDSFHQWQPDSVNFVPGFTANTHYRGTSKSNYGANFASKITDGDTSENSVWYSDPQVLSQDPYAIIDLGSTKSVDSIAIYWGQQGIGQTIEVQAWTGATWPYPYQSLSNSWQTVVQSANNTSRNQWIKFPSVKSAQMFRVISHSSTNSNGKTVGIREIVLFAAGKAVTVNTNVYGQSSGNQSAVTAMPTIPASDSTAYTGDWDFETYMSYVRNYPNSTPVICVNYGTGTPQEAAAWVHYANKVKGYQISHWQVGNEMDGNWEEGGPVSASAYAERFLAYAKAMKAQDPSIKIYGPVASGDINGEGDGSDAPIKWMQHFLQTVGAAEKAAASKYLDGVDFHVYPYYFSTAPDDNAMMAQVDYVKQRSDTLKSWIQAYLYQPESTKVNLSEYNSSVVMSNQLQRQINGAFAASFMANQAQSFGKQGQAMIWESIEGLSVGPDGSYGSLSLFNSNSTIPSKFSLPPSSAWWGMESALNLWMHPQNPNQLLGVTGADGSSIRSWALKTGSEYRLMLVNTASTAQDVQIQGLVGNNIDVYRWNDSLFQWNGTDQNAYAAPNLGAIANRSSSLGLQTLAPFELRVVRWSPMENPSVPYWVHDGADRFISDSLHPALVFGLARADSGTVDTLAWRIDQGAWTTILGSSSPARSLQLSLAASQTGRGVHWIYLKAVNQAGFAVDSMQLTFMGNLRPVAWIDQFENTSNGWKCMMPSATSWTSYANNDKADSAKVTTAQLSRIAQSNGNHLALLSALIYQPSTLTYTNFAQLTLPLDFTGMNGNASQYSGIRFDYATTASASTQSFQIFLPTDTVKDYDDFQVALAPTQGQWQSVILKWSDFQQANWGKLVGVFNPNWVKNLQYRINGAGTATLSLDNVAFVSDSGTALSLNPLVASVSKSLGNFLQVQKQGGGYVINISSPNPILGELSVWDSQGRQLALIWHGHGSASVVWPDVNSTNKVAAGQYYLRFKSNQGSQEYPLQIQ